jgi:hypothetical protein
MPGSRTVVTTGGTERSGDLVNLLRRLGRE